MKYETIVNISFTDGELATFIGDRTIELDDNEDYEILSCYPAIGEFKFRVFTKEDKETECTTQNQCNMDMDELN